MSFWSSIGSGLGKVGSTIGNGIIDFVSSGAGIGSLVSTGANFVGNLLSKSSNDKANAQNLQVAQMNNEFNERMLNKQLAYNSASAQVDRFRQAGLNPYLAMQGQGAGQASTTTAAATPEVRPYNWDFSNIGNAVQAGIQSHLSNQMLDEQINGIRIENQYKRQKIIQELALLREQELSAGVKRRIDQKIHDNLDRQQTADYEETLARTDDLRSQIAKRSAEILMLDKEIAKFDENFDIMKAEAVSRTLLNGAMTARTKQEMRTEVFNTLKAQYDAGYAKQNARNLARMSDAIVDKAYADVDNINADTARIKSEAGSSWFSGTLSNLLGIGLGFGLSRIPGVNPRMIVKGFRR